MAARADLNLALKAGGRGASGELRAWFRSVLVVGQVALSLMLLVSGGLFVRSLDRARQIELGFDPDNVRRRVRDSERYGLRPSATPGVSTAARARGCVALPGVERAAWIEWAPLSTVSEGGPIRLESQPTRADEPPPMAAVARADPGYFATAHIPILDGRTFTDRDDDSAEPVAIVNQTLATQFWPNLSPVGRFFVVQGSRVQVVGVVPNGKYLFIWESPRPMVFRPLRQSAPRTSDAGRAEHAQTSRPPWRASAHAARRRSRGLRVRRADDGRASCQRGRWVPGVRTGRDRHERLRRGRRAAGRHRSLRDDRGPGLAAHAGVRRAHRARRRSRRHPPRCARPRHAPRPRLASSPVLRWRRSRRRDSPRCCSMSVRSIRSLMASCLCSLVVCALRVVHSRASSDARRSHRRAASGVVDVDSRDVHAPPLDVQASSTGRRSRRRDSRASRTACR